MQSHSLYSVSSHRDTNHGHLNFGGVFPDCIALGLSIIFWIKTPENSESKINIMEDKFDCWKKEDCPFWNIIEKSACNMRFL